VNDAANSLCKQPVNMLEEVFENEAVIINIASGYYYSLNEAATEIWQLFTEPRGSAQLAELLSPGQSKFVERLREHDLLVASDAPPVALAAAPVASAPPVLERFDEMADLLQFDPVHDIDLDGDGWPVVREGFTRPASA
jgi:hypothetical protein